MRVTESRLRSISTESLSYARQRVAAAEEEIGSGQRVSRPSQGIADWAQGERARARYAQSDSRGDSINSSKEQLSEADRSLNSISALLGEARSLAVQGSSGTLTTDERKNLATMVKSIREQALSVANSVGPNGEFLFSGTSNTAPFDRATGAFLGNNTARNIEVAEGQQQTVSLTGETLTAAAGVDLFGTLDALSTALDTNNVAGMRASLDSLDTATKQVSSAMTQLGSQVQALNSADDARLVFEESLARIVSRAQESDPVEAASRLAQSATAMEMARASTEQIFALLKSR
jgi:flagellar hook-associated protein 3 FlgL